MKCTVYLALIVYVVVSENQLLTFIPPISLYRDYVYLAIRNVDSCTYWIMFFDYNQTVENSSKSSAGVQSILLANCILQMQPVSLDFVWATPEIEDPILPISFECFLVYWKPLRAWEIPLLLQYVSGQLQQLNDIDPIQMLP